MIIPNVAVSRQVVDLDTLLSVAAVSREKVGVFAKNVREDVDAVRHGN